MGQNSTEVAYGFGQLGSAFQNLAKPVYPPKDHVIVAIQFLADNTPTSMVTETLEQVYVRLTVGEGKELDVIKDLTKWVELKLETTYC